MKYQPLCGPEQENLFCAFADLIDDVHPVSIQGVVDGGHSRKDQQVVAGVDVLAMMKFRQVFRTRLNVRAADGQ